MKSDKIKAIKRLLTEGEQFDVDVVGFFVERYRQHEPNKVAFLGEIIRPRTNRGQQVLKHCHATKEGAKLFLEMFGKDWKTILYSEPIIEMI